MPGEYYKKYIFKRMVSSKDKACMCEERLIVSIFIGGSCFRIVTLWPHWPAYSGYHHLIVDRRFLFF